VLEIIITILGITLLVTVGIAGWLFADRRQLQRRSSELADESQQTLEQRQAAEQKVAQLQTELEVARQALTAAKEQFEQAQQQARETFKSLAGDALRQSNEQFLQLAKQQFKTEQTEAEKTLDAKRSAVEALVKPINEALLKYNNALNDVERSRRQAYGSLTEQVKQLHEHQQSLLRETANLSSALRRADVGGRWGEMQLRRIAELAGMVPNCDFYEQQTVSGQDSKLRPDMVVKMPSDRTIVVDSKTVIRSYLDALEAGDEHQRQQKLEEHARSVESRVRDLSSKQYQSQFEHSPDFVVQFIPGEAFLYAALQVKPNLVESAMEKQVVIATPTTLISLLKVVALGWREQQVAKSAAEISDLGRQLHERIALAINHVQGVGKSLESAMDSYNRLIGSLEMRVLPAARKFEQLGAQSAKTLPDNLPELEANARPIRAVEADS